MTTWESFSEPARRVVYFAQEEARLAGWAEVMPVHFLMAVFHDKECFASKALEVSGVELEKIVAVLRENMPRPDVAENHEPNFVEMVLSSRSKIMFKLSYKRVNAWKNKQFTTAHLLLGLLDLGILREHGLPGLDFNELRVRQEAKRLKDKPEADLLREKENR